MVNQMNQSKMSVIGNVMMGQKVTSPTQISSKLINDNVISTQHLGNNNNNNNNNFINPMQLQPIQSTQLINANIDSSSTNLSEQLQMSAFMPNNGYNNEHNFTNNNNITTNNTNLSSSSSSSILGKRMVELSILLFEKKHNYFKIHKGNNEHHSNINIMANDSNSIEQPPQLPHNSTVNINNQLPHLTYATVVANMANNIDQNLANNTNISQNNPAQNLLNRKQTFPLNESLDITDLPDLSLSSIDLLQTPPVLQNTSNFFKRESDLQQQNQIKANNDANLERLDILLKNCLSNETPANMSVSTPPIQESVISLQQQQQQQQQTHSTNNSTGVSATVVISNLNPSNSNIQLTQINDTSNLR
jgi:hypothetical protein